MAARRTVAPLPRLRLRRGNRDGPANLCFFLGQLLPRGSADTRAILAVLESPRSDVASRRRRRETRRRRLALRAVALLNGAQYGARPPGCARPKLETRKSKRETGQPVDERSCHGAAWQAGFCAGATPRWGGGRNMAAEASSAVSPSRFSTFHGFYNCFFFEHLQAQSSPRREDIRPSRVYSFLRRLPSRFIFPAIIGDSPTRRAGFFLHMRRMHVRACAQGTHAYAAPRV